MECVGAAFCRLKMHIGAEMRKFMREFVIFTDGDVDVPKEYQEEVVLLPQYYYFEENMIYGNEQVLSREEFFGRLSRQRAYTSGVNPFLVHEKFEKAIQAGMDILCIAVSSGLSGSYNTICMEAEQLKQTYPDCRIEVIDSLSATLGSGFLCVDAIQMKKQGKTLSETAEEVRRRVPLIDIYFVVDDFKYLVQGGRVSPAVGKIGDMLNIKLILTMKDGHIEPYKKNRGLQAALRDIRNIVKRGETAQVGTIYVGNQEMYTKLHSYVTGESEAELNLIVSSHVGPNTTGIAIEWEKEKPF